MNNGLRSRNLGKFIITNPATPYEECATVSSVTSPTSPTTTDLMITTLLTRCIRIYEDEYINVC